MDTKIQLQLAKEANFINPPDGNYKTWFEAYSHHVDLSAAPLTFADFRAKYTALNILIDHDPYCNNPEISKNINSLNKKLGY